MCHIKQHTCESLKKDFKTTPMIIPVPDYGPKISQVWLQYSWGPLKIQKQELKSLPATLYSGFVLNEWAKWRALNKSNVRGATLITSATLNTGKTVTIIINGCILLLNNLVSL